MAEQDTMRLAAEVVDKFSSPIRDMTRQLQALNKIAQQQQKEGVIGAKEHIKWFGELRQTTHRLSDEVKGVLTPAMAAFGLGSLSVAGAIAAITKSVVDFGAAARNLSVLSQFSGLSVQSVRVYEELAAALGSSKTEMDGFISSFSTNMDQWRRLGRGPMAEFFATQPAEIRNLGIALRHTTDNAQALNQVFDFLADTRYTDVQKKILTDAIGMPAAFVHAGASARELYAKLNAEVKPLDKGWEQRKQRYLESMALLSAAWSNLSLHIGDTMSTSFADMADTIRKFIDDNGPEIRKFFVDFGKDVGEVGGAAKDMASSLGMVRDIINEFRAGEPVDLKKLIDFSGLEQALDIFMAVWKARWSAFKASLGLGGDAAAAADEAARREALRKYRPGDLEEEDRAAAARAKTDTRELAKQKEYTPGWEPEEKTWLQRLKEDWTKRSAPPAASFNERFGETAPAEAGPAAPAKKMNYTVPENSGAGIVKAAYTTEGPNPLRAAQSSIKFPAEETLGGAGGGSTSDAINVIAIGTRKGVYDGMVDYYQYLLGTKGGAGEGPPGGAGGLTRASYGPGGQGGAPAGTGRAGGLGGGEATPMGGLAGKAGLEYPTSLDQLREAGKAAAGTRGDRNNNPGNIEYGEFAKAHGAIGSDGRFAIFPNKAAGTSAMGELLKSKYAGLTLAQIQKKWVGNVDQDYLAGLSKSLGIGANDVPNLNDPKVLAGIQKGIARGEGTSLSEGGRAKAPQFSVADIRERVQGGGGAAAAGINTGTVPSEVLAKARQVALQGGPGAVQRFMASQGHPMAGSWCGEFAASVIHAAGGTPPRDPAIASNWRNWGVHTEVPQPGDVAVRKGTRTGATGSHVTFVEDFDPKTGSFTGLGGNQGRWESRFNASQFEFRHGEKIQEAAQEAAKMAKESSGLHGAALREHFGHRGRRAADLAPGDLLKHAQHVGMAGTMHHKVTGRAGVDINLTGFPRGTTTQASLSGIFNEVKLNRGATPRADQVA